MCWCTPSIRTPKCHNPDCQPPKVAARLILHPEGFYKIKVNGHPGVGYCHHEKGWQEAAPYETWAVIYLRPGVIDEHPVWTNITPRSDTRWHLEVLEPVE